MLAYYTFDEEAGQVANDTAPAGNNYHADVNGGTWLPAGGQVGGCLDLDGQVTAEGDPPETPPTFLSHDVIRINHDMGTRQQVSLSMWVKWDSFPPDWYPPGANTGIWVNGDWYEGVVHLIRMPWGDIEYVHSMAPWWGDFDHVKIYINGVRAFWGWPVEPIIGNQYLGEWTHFCFVHDNYLFPEPIPGVEMNDTYLLSSSEAMGGDIGPGLARYADAKIDEVRFYDYPLTDAEVMWLAGVSDIYFPLDSPAELYDTEPINSRMIDFKDFSILSDPCDVVPWDTPRLWP
jgi:hypothetical protein